MRQPQNWYDVIETVLVVVVTLFFLALYGICGWIVIAALAS